MKSIMIHFFNCVVVVRFDNISDLSGSLHDLQERANVKDILQVRWYDTHIEIDATL